MVSRIDVTITGCLVLSIVGCRPWQYGLGLSEEHDSTARIRWRRLPHTPLSQVTMQGTGGRGFITALVARLSSTAQ
ncbi:hypothetical protein QBC46DRAFT_395226 [Diplogelasinospora grovesii]|uniref:Uncharacterized protein n=1 Tax=Diplogelasinospora grovesii TaxID=303347 RepID=A0AAN6MZH2_9PEZI|nr:hypothetical protein QBC46DRAFT_395226 [Diplogelasinospora grovesii]